MTTQIDKAKPNSRIISVIERGRNQRNCAALAHESGGFPVDLEPDWRSCRNRMDEHGVEYRWGWFARWPFVKATESPEQRVQARP